MSIILDCFGTMVFFGTPTAVELSVWKRLRGCDHPMSLSVCHWGTILRAAIKSAASASANEAMANLMMVVIVRITLLNCGGGLSSER